MTIHKLDWAVGFTSDPFVCPKEMYPATVPGSVQLDYAAANQLPPFQYGINYESYQWMEDVFWLYQTTLSFNLTDTQSATIIFEGIDYQYQIRIDSTVIAEGEGMFSPVSCDISKYAGAIHTLEVLIFPAPKADTSNTRSQVRFSCKPAACYGWDWHPRLISAGLCGDVSLIIQDIRHIDSMDVSYVLSQSLDSCELRAQLQLSAECLTCVQLIDGGILVAEETRFCGPGRVDFHLTVNQPKLWYPTGLGEQHLYELQAATLDSIGTILTQIKRKIGFRRSRLLMNDGSWSHPRDFPKSRSDAPATLEINHRRIFAKGSNWVNAHIFSGSLTPSAYSSLLSLVQDAHMNILRIWGGGFVNHEAFYDLCDEKGIMIWQEFPLACNEYPDDDHYLSVLEKEATSIVRRLRTHPCLVLWCGGNELFNSWSGMTEQHHALRLLDKICYTEDRFTPFIMTSPLNGMAHGHYINYDERTQEEFISSLVRSTNTAYTEFGSPSAADPDYIRQYLSAEDYKDCENSNAAWRAHHAFYAWEPESWLRKSEVEFYFGGYSDVDDLCLKTRFIQAMCYRTYFEEMRKQWPRCTMALNWCFNEPWPSFANNNLISWPDIPKPSFYAVKQALRPQLASLQIDRHLWWAGDTFFSKIWLLNDSSESISDLDIIVHYRIGEQAPILWGTLHCDKLPAQTNVQCGALSFELPREQIQKIHITLDVPNHPEMASEYTYLCRSRTTVSTAGMLNI